MVRAITLGRLAASLLVILPFAAFLYAPSPGFAAPILGSDLASFAILGGGGVTINGTGSVITGSVGAFPTTSITGVVPTNFTISGGTVQSGGGTASSAQGQLGVAVNALSAMTPTDTPVGGLLGGLVLNPGVYSSLSTMSLTGTLTLDGLTNPNALWVFQVGSTLNTAANSVVSVINTGAGAGIYWVLPSIPTGDATLGANSIFEGNILANNAITVGDTVTMGCGRALAQVASVTLTSTDTIGIGCTGIGEETASNGWSGGGTIENGVVIPTPFGGGGQVPEPSTLLLLAAGLIGVAARMRRAKAR